MDFSIDVIKKDIKELPEKEALIKYLLKSDNWYFSQYQDQSGKHSIEQMDTLKEILNKNIGIAFHNVLMVGSGKTGCSFAPGKNFKKFDEGDDNSDIDIAIISSKFFNELWEKIRFESSVKYSAQYKQITSSIFRGFINEHNFRDIDEVRPTWTKQIDDVNKEVQKNLSIYHSINYRIYRSWEDLEIYHINGLKKLKQQI